ncbi:MAG: hypothetical protein IJ418_13110 [Clostridia bacterium]|nr:hypothetical protein [Clostridia bacterium]
MELLMQLSEVNRLNKISDDLESQGFIAESEVIYGQMWRLANEAAETLRQIVGGELTFHEALRMVINQDGTILALITKAA